MTNEADRSTYVKRITEIMNNFNRQKSEMQKIVKDVKDLEESTTFYSQSLERNQVEIENTYNSDSKKAESQNKQIFKIYNEYRDIFNKTLNNLKEVGKKKIEARELEVKKNLLTAKGFQKSIDKLKFDLQEIKKENEKLEKSVPT